MAFTQKKAEYVHQLQYVPIQNNTSKLDPSQPDVNSTIKSLPKDSDVKSAEIEKGEVVLSGDGRLMTARGKSHAQGGIPVNLTDNSFIFSNFKPLSLTKQDKEDFNLKMGGDKPKANTPAKTVQKNVDIEHHNKMVAIQGDPIYDNISKTSSALMLQKNISKLGQIGYLQEEKKGFPEGLPPFSQGTAPLLNEQLEEEVETQKQYKMGGFIPLKKFPIGGTIWTGDKYKPRKAGTSTSNGTQYGQGQWDDLADIVGYKGTDGVAGFQKYLYNLDNGRFKNQIDQLHKDYAPGPNNGMFDGKLGVRWDGIYDSLQENPYIGPINPSFKDPNMDLAPPPATTTPAPATPSPAITSQEDVLSYNPKVPLSNSQKLSLAYDAYNAASVQRYYPKREQVSFTPLTLNRINAQPYLNQVNNSVSEAYNQSSGYNPIIARANNSQVYGKALDQRNQVLGNVDNQNIQIGNQEAQYNNQGVNNTNRQNTQLDQSYYDQVQQLNQNFDNEKRFANNNTFSQYNQYKSQNDQLQMQLASQPTYGSKTVYVNDRGDISAIPKQGYTAKKQAAPLYDYNSKTNSVYYTGAGMSLDQLPASSSTYKDLLYKNLYEKYQKGTISKDELKSLAYITRGK